MSLHARIAEYAERHAGDDSFWATVSASPAVTFYRQTGYSLREVRAYSDGGRLGWQGGYGLLGVRVYAPGAPTDD